MESRTQTVTVPPVLNTVNSGGKTETNVSVNSGRPLAVTELPDPKPKPQEAKKPEDVESLEDRMATDDEIDENKRQWEAYDASEWARYVALKEEVESVNPDGFIKDDGNEEDGQGSRNILAGMSFRNGHQVNELLLDQLRTVLETDADRTKRDEGYKYLNSVASKEKGLKTEWDHNVVRMMEWARSGYSGAFQPTYLNEDGSEIMGKDGEAVHSPPNVEDEYWSKQKHAKQAPPDEDKLLRLPKTKAMDDIRAQAGALLQETAEHPDLVRGECGKQLGTLNETISEISADYIETYNSSVGTEEERISSLIDQRIPDIRIFQMIVEFAELMVSTGQDGLGEFPDAKKEYDLLKMTMSRAGHPPEWFDMIETTVSQKVLLARKFNNETPGRDYHEHPDLWQSDLRDWLIQKVDAGERHSSNRTKAHQVNSGNPASNQNPVSFDGSAPEDVRSSEPPSEGGMEGITTNMASTGQSPGVAGATAIPGPSTSAGPTGPSTAAPVPSTLTTPLPPKISGGSVLTQTVRYKRALRLVGGVRNLRLNAFQCLVQMNDENAVNPFWHIVAAGKLNFDPVKYLEEGGYLVKGTKSTREEEKKNSVEGGVKDLKGYKLSAFKMKGIAVIFRESGEGYQNNTMHIVQGYIEAEGPEKSKFYTISTLATAFGKHNQAIHEAVEEHMEKNNFPLQAKPLARPTARPRRGKRFSRGESEDEGIDIEHESDGPLDPNDGIYHNEGASKFVEQNPTASSSVTQSNKGDGSQRGGDYFNAAFTVPNSKSRPTPTGTNQQKEDVNERIRTLEIGFQNMETTLQRMEKMMATMTVNPGSQS